MNKKILLVLIACVSLATVHGQNIIATTNLVADYDYTCHTVNGSNEPADIHYSLILQVTPKLACTMGQQKHAGENDVEEQLNYVPTTWQNYPKEKMTSLEAVPPYRYLTTEKMTEIQWTLQADRDTLCGYPCQKATGSYGGRTWIAWFAESLPTKFGVWRLNGLPGLILRAESEDGIHRFDCRSIEAVKEDVTYDIPTEVTRCTRAKFVQLRNKIFGNENYVSSPTYYIKPAEISSVTMIGGTVLLGNVPINMKPTKFQPLDY
jgi:GLPGLI family protein